MIFIGIAFGIATALSQCFAYVFSRLFVLRHRNALWQLLVASHIYMGLAALIGLPFVWPDSLPPLSRYAWPVIGAGGFYLVGQVGLFVAMRLTNPSRVAPLLGIKIIILALLATFVFGKTITSTQWIAVFACFGAVAVLNFSGGSLPLGAIVMLLFTCTGYSLSDIHIDKLVHALAPLPTLHAAMLGAFLTYVLLGIVAALIVPLAKPRTLFTDRHLAVPFAAFWFIAMLTLFICIGVLGPVFAVILQSSRGLMSVVLGGVLAHRGWSEVEPRVSPRVLMQRIVAAALMIAAVALYVT